MRIANCRACGAPIIFVKTLSGKAMPVDATPHERGNLQIEERGNEVVLVPPTEDGDHYISHFATCTSPERFRKPRSAQ